MSHFTNTRAIHPANLIRARLFCTVLSLLITLLAGNNTWKLHMGVFNKWHFRGSILALPSFTYGGRTGLICRVALHVPCTMYHVRSVVIETSKLATILKLSFLPLTLLIISTKWGPKETGIKTKIACFWSMFWTSFMTLVSVVSWLANVSFTGYFKGWYCVWDLLYYLLVIILCFTSLLARKRSIEKCL